MIFMIGCGHVEEGQWRFRCFTAADLTESAEAEIIDGWLDHMASVQGRLAPEGPLPRVFHWSPAETSTFETAYNSALKRHPDRAWPSPAWFDFLNRVVRAEPVVVRGALKFGLKPVAKAFQSHGLIETEWSDEPIDGLGAMAAAWWCAEQAAYSDCRLDEVPLMQKIAHYNEVDCKVMMEIVRYLRASH